MASYQLFLALWVVLPQFVELRQKHPLLRVVDVPSDNFVPTVVRVARNLLSMRGLNDDNRIIFIVALMMKR